MDLVAFGLSVIRPEVPSLNLQEKKGQAKPYQLRQMKETIEAYNL